MSGTCTLELAYASAPRLHVTPFLRQAQEPRELYYPKLSTSIIGILLIRKAIIYIQLGMGIRACIIWKKIGRVTEPIRVN